MELFKRFPEVLAHYRRRWQYVLVDEYQDTNRVQYRLVKQIAGEHRNLCVVGDPDQSIYAWRGADVRNILDFERDYPEAKVVKLERNYRSTQPILSGASGVVANNVARKRKSSSPSARAATRSACTRPRTIARRPSFVVREIVSRNARGEGRPYGDFAIFYRTNAQSRVFEEELLKYDIPYVVVGGVRFYDRAEVKDALAYLRLMFNPADSAGATSHRQQPTRGIGKTTLDRAHAIAGAASVTTRSKVFALRRVATWEPARRPRCGVSSRCSTSSPSGGARRVARPARSPVCWTAAATRRSRRRVAPRPRRASRTSAS